MIVYTLEGVMIMRHMTVKIIFLIFLFLLIGGAIFFIMRTPGEREGFSYIPGFSIREQNQSDTEQAPAGQNQAPVQSPVPATPEPTPEPTPTPVPTPTPYVPTPEPVPQLLGSGSFETGRALLLNMHADWRATTIGNGVAVIEVVVYADHYSLDYSPVGLTISVGTAVQQLESKEIRTYINNPQSTEIGRAEFSMPYNMGESASFPLKVKWDFVGTYVDYGSNPVEIYGYNIDETIRW